jgi:hypothetical protein
MVARIIGAWRVGNFMNDLIFIAVMIAFFALAALYARFCEKIQE